MRAYYKKGGSVKKSPAWQRKEGKSESGGLNAKVLRVIVGRTPAVSSKRL